MTPKKYPKRDLGRQNGLPADTWLYDHAEGFRMMPGHFPPLCTWCLTKMEVLHQRWRRCPKCDAPSKGDR